MSEKNGINGDTNMKYGQYNTLFSYLLKITSQLPLFFTSSPCVSVSQVAQWAGGRSRLLDMSIYVRL